MPSPVDRSNPILTSQNLSDFLDAEIPPYADKIESDSGLYEVLGDFAIFLRDGIDQGTITDSEMEAAFRVLNCMGLSEDLEVQNLLVVGVLEILSDYRSVVPVVKRRLDGDAIRSFEKVLSGWKHQ